MEGLPSLPLSSRSSTASFSKFSKEVLARVSSVSGSASGSGSGSQTPEKEPSNPMRITHVSRHSTPTTITGVPIKDAAEHAIVKTNADEDAVEIVAKTAFLSRFEASQAAYLEKHRQNAGFVESYELWLAQRKEELAREQEKNAAREEAERKARGEDPTKEKKPRGKKMEMACRLGRDLVNVPRDLKDESPSLTKICGKYARMRDGCKMKIGKVIKKVLPVA